MYLLSRNYDGFTLLEVLISLAIVSVLFTAILTAIRQHISGSSYIVNKLAMMQVAENVLVTKSAFNNEMLNADEGKMEMNNNIFKWKLMVTLEDSNNRWLLSLIVENADKKYDIDNMFYKLSWYQYIAN